MANDQKSSESLDDTVTKFVKDGFPKISYLSCSTMAFVG